MLRKQWQEYALKARQIAKRIVSGDEVNKDGLMANANPQTILLT